jgi:hypothetical protein
MVLPKYTAALLILGSLLPACEVKVSNVDKAACSTSTDATQFKQSVLAALQRDDFPCSESLLQNAKGSDPVPAVFDGLHQAIARQAVPNSTKAYIVSYLLYAGDPSGLRLVQDNAAALQTAASSGSEEQRATAIAALSTRRSDDDIETFVRAITSGGEMPLAYSAFALADNCSPEARRKLADVMHSAAMTQYLSKYRDRESISEVVRKKCPV